MASVSGGAANAVRHKVLVVEDDDILRIVLRIELEKAGYGVFEAENGQRGLEVAGRDNPDLILTDIMMPVMDGLTFIGAIRKFNGVRTVPIIAMSAIKDNELAQKAIDRGANEFMTKPLSTGALVESINKYFPRH